MFIYIYYYGGGIVNRTRGAHKNLYIYVFLLRIFGPIYYVPVCSPRHTVIANTSAVSAAD